MEIVYNKQNAYSINLLYDKFIIPKGAELCMIKKNHSLGAFTDKNNKSMKLFQQRQQKVMSL